VRCHLPVALRLLLVLLLVGVAGGVEAAVARGLLLHVKVRQRLGLLLGPRGSAPQVLIQICHVI
jgi:hypothetical protein